MIKPIASNIINQLIVSLIHEQPYWPWYQYILNTYMLNTYMISQENLENVVDLTKENTFSKLANLLVQGKTSFVINVITDTRCINIFEEDDQDAVIIWMKKHADYIIDPYDVTFYVFFN